MANDIKNIELNIEALKADVSCTLGKIHLELVITPDVARTILESIGIDHTDLIVRELSDDVIKHAARERGVVTYVDDYPI